jgi:glycosyltransferase involved in cell wall biosynthesis
MAAKSLLNSRRCLTVLFSVIIPTYNRAALLRDALDSVFAQEFTDFEVIVVDDGSTDETPMVVSSFGKRTRFFRQDNKGAGVARNLGIRYASGDYTAFLDSDDLWFPWTLGTFAALISQYNRPAILSAKLIEFSNEAELVDVKPSIPRALAFPDYYLSHAARCFTGAGMAVLHRGQLLKTGGFTDYRINGEDHDLILRMGTAPGFVQILKPVTLGWRRHSSSATKDVWRTFEGMSYLVDQERRGDYPGGPERAAERWQILTARLRPAMLDCLREGLHRGAWRLYRSTFNWHVRLGRWRFLAAFPVVALIERWRRGLKRGPPPRALAAL